MEEKYELRWFLAIKMEKKPGETIIDQEQKTEDLLKKQGMINCNPLKIPERVNEEIVKVNDSDELADATSHRILIGSLLFPAKQIPLILYFVSILYLF